MSARERLVSLPSSSSLSTARPSTCPSFSPSVSSFSPSFADSLASFASFESFALFSGSWNLTPFFFSPDGSPFSVLPLSFSFSLPFSFASADAARAFSAFSAADAAALCRLVPRSTRLRASARSSPIHESIPFSSSSTSTSTSSAFSSSFFRRPCFSACSSIVEKAKLIATSRSTPCSRETVLAMFSSLLSSNCFGGGAWKALALMLAASRELVWFWAAW